jgi:hypothetical protein
METPTLCQTQAVTLQANPDLLQQSARTETAHIPLHKAHIALAHSITIHYFTAPKNGPKDEERFQGGILNQ